MADHPRLHYEGQSLPPGVSGHAHPPPPAGLPPSVGPPLHLPPRPPPMQHGMVQPMYQFGSHQQQPGSHQAGQFTFQAPKEISAFRLPPPTGPSGHRRNQPGGDPKRAFRREGARQRAPYQRAPTSDRPLLRTRRGATPEQLAGMVAESGAEKRFHDLNDLSDSSDEAMDHSEDEVDAVSDGEQSDLPVTKKQKIDCQPPASSGGEPTRPKWSNPEPYTALPPPSQGQRKKKDVVKLIRKARVVSEKSSEKPNQVATNDDFISFDMDDDEPTSPAQLRAAERNAIVMDSLRMHGSRGTSQANGHQPPSDNLPTGMAQGDPVLVDMLSTDRKRKRPLELEDTVMLKQPKLRQTSKRFPSGTMMDEWRVEGRNVNPIPWQTSSHTFAERPGFR